MSIQFNRPQAIALFALAMQYSDDVILEATEQDSNDAITVVARTHGFEVEHQLPKYGGSSTVATRIH